MISVIITVYEQRPSLELLLHCLKMQDCDEDIEILICDDGSSCDMHSMLFRDAELSALDVRYIWQTKRGHRASKSKNNGIRAASGDLLIFIDGDIVIPPRFLSRHRSAHVTGNQIVCNPRLWLSESVAPGGAAQSNRSVPGNDIAADLLRLFRACPDDMFHYLERHSFEFDLMVQKSALSSSAPWMACIGCSLSIKRSGAIWFEEGFEGWGPEDRELALRLIRRHGYRVTFLEDLRVFHLDNDSTGRDPGSIFPRSPSAIWKYLKNMCYLYSLYPDEDLSPIMTPVMMYRLNERAGLWEMGVTPRSSEQFTRQDLEKQIDKIEKWMEQVPKVVKSFESQPGCRNTTLRC